MHRSLFENGLTLGVHKKSEQLRMNAFRRTAAEDIEIEAYLGHCQDWWAGLAVCSVQHLGRWRDFSISAVGEIFGLCLPFRVCGISAIGEMFGL